jgi:hypothetical protein
MPLIPQPAPYPFVAEAAAMAAMDAADMLWQAIGGGWWDDDVMAELLTPGVVRELERRSALPNSEGMPAWQNVSVKS